MNGKDFTLTLITNQKPAEVFTRLLDVRSWWSGLFNEKFEGRSEKTGDEFIFRAGDGVHYSKQKLVELVPGKKIVWLVTDSKLNFLGNTSEWTNTRISFEISTQAGKTRIRFTHEGLVPEMECYNNCSPAWTQYLTEKLKPLIKQ